MPINFRFPTDEAQILFMAEMQGQISDGMWENASPRMHFQVWVRLTFADTIVDAENPGRCGSTIYVRKNNYNFTSKELLDVVGDRMRYFLSMYRLNPFFVETMIKRGFHLPESYDGYKKLFEYVKTSDHFQKYIDIFNEFELGDDFFKAAEDELPPMREVKHHLELLKNAFRTVAN